MVVTSSDFMHRWNFCVAQEAMYHVIANNYLEFVDKDHAHLEAYW